MGANRLSDETWELIGRKIYEENKESEKKLFSQKGSIYYEFMDEIRSLGFEVESGMQANRICKLHSELTKPIIIKYYNKTALREEKWKLLDSLINHQNKDLIPFFIEEFYKNDKYLRDIIGNCLAETSDKSYLSKYLHMLEDKSLGNDRLIILLTINKLKDKKAIETLLKLLNEEDISKNLVLNSLTKYKDPSLLSYFEKYKDDKNTNIRNTAKRGIKTIEKILGR